MLTTTPRFKTKTGRLTAYAFSVGYRERKKTCEYNGIETELYYDGTCYHVRQFDYRKDAKTFRIFWDTYLTLNEARNRFNRQPGRLSRGRNG